MHFISINSMGILEPKHVKFKFKKNHLIIIENVWKWYETTESVAHVINTLI